jgi:hypothetical protein
MNTRGTPHLYSAGVEAAEEYRVFASGAYALSAGPVRPQHRLDVHGEAALELERPLHLAAAAASRTLCGMPVVNLREYPVVFSDQDVDLRCPMCDEVAG